MKKIPRNGGLKWPALVFLLMLLLLSPNVLAQDAEAPGDETPDTGEAVEDTGSVEASDAEADESETTDVETEDADTEEPVSIDLSGTAGGITTDEIVNDLEVDSEEVDPLQMVYDSIESLRPNSTVMVVFDYDTANETELFALSLAFLRHCFDRNIKVLAFTNSDNQLSFMSSILPMDGTTEDPSTEEPLLPKAVEFIKRPIVADEVLGNTKWVMHDKFTIAQLIWLDHIVDLYFGEDADPASLAINEEWLERVLILRVGTIYIESAIARLEAEYSIESGVDYINFGYVESDDQVAYTALEVDYVFNITNGDSPAWWLDNVFTEENFSSRQNVEFGIGASYGTADGFKGFIGENGFSGLIRGVQGVARYEELIGHPGRASTFIPDMSKFQMPTEMEVIDLPNDEGGKLVVSWPSITDPNAPDLEEWETPEPVDSKPDTWYDDTLVQWGYDSSTGDPLVYPGFEYWAYHSDSGEPGTWGLFGITQSNLSNQWEVPNSFGFFLSYDKRGPNKHYATYGHTYPSTGIYNYQINYIGMPAMGGITRLGDFDYMVIVSDGGTLDAWLTDAAEASELPVTIGCTSNNARRYAPYFESGRINGLIAGEEGAYLLSWLTEHDPDKETEEETEEVPDEPVAEEVIPTFSVDVDGNPTIRMSLMRGHEIIEIVEDEERPDPEVVTPSTKAVYDFIVDELEPGSTVLVVTDFGQESSEDLQPIIEAVYLACFKENQDIVSVSSMPIAETLSAAALKYASDTEGAEYGTDFVNLGFKDFITNGETEDEPAETDAPADPDVVSAMISALTNDIPGNYPTDMNGSLTGLDIVEVSVQIYDKNVTDYSSLAVFCNLRPIGGEKVQLEYVTPDESAEGKPWDNQFVGIGTWTPAEVSITKPTFLMFSANVSGQKIVVMAATVSETDGIRSINGADSEPNLPDNRDPHYFLLYVVPNGYELLEGTDLPPAEWQIGNMVGPVIARQNAWNWSRTNNFLWALMIFMAVFGYIFMARRGASLYLRRIAGLDHVEEAIGRATEMGRPILYSTGLGYISDIATIASINILGQVARKVADYDSRLINPHRDPIIMAVCQEVLQEAYVDAGRPDAYNKDDCFFITDDQFAYAAAVNGIMVREKPATIFLMGMFYAESLLLAETGASTGAIQIAGTDAQAQLPFFITACDYTLIGEELYAASAYLSREPLLVGSLKGQDLAKLVFMAMTLIGTILICANVEFIQQLFQAF